MKVGRACVERGRASDGNLATFSAQVLTVPCSGEDSSAETKSLKFPRYFTIYIAESNFLPNREPLGHVAPLPSESVLF